MKITIIGKLVFIILCLLIAVFIFLLFLIIYCCRKQDCIKSENARKKFTLFRRDNSAADNYHNTRNNIRCNRNENYESNNTILPMRSSL